MSQRGTFLCANAQKRSTLARFIGLAHTRNIHYNTYVAKDLTAKKDIDYGSNEQGVKAKQAKP